MRIEAIVALHAALAIRVCPDTGTEFLKVHTYPVESDAASAVWAFDFRQCGHISDHLRKESIHSDRTNIK